MPTLLLASCVTLDKLLPLSEPQLPRVYHDSVGFSSDGPQGPP